MNMRPGRWLRRGTIVAAGIGLALPPGGVAAHAHNNTGRQVVTAAFQVQPGEGADTVARCPTGKVTTGGGHFHGSTTGLVIDISRPFTGSQGWHVHALNTTSGPRTITAYAVCANGKRSNNGRTRSAG